MSVRAHRILKVEYAPNTSFNLWHNEKLVEFLEKNNPHGFNDKLDMDGNGVVSIDVSVIKQAIEKAEELELEEDVVEQLKADIEAVGDEPTIDYDCF